MLPADSPFAPLPAPGSHPATAELRAYAAGTLSPTDEHRIEAHALNCERCAELLEGFSMSNAPTTDRALAELRTRLQARVGVPNAAPAAPTRTWPKLAAAAALMGVVAAGWWGLEQRDTDTATATVARMEVPQPAAPAPPAEPTSPAATPATPPAAATAAAPATESIKEEKAAYVAVAPTPPRRRAAPPRAARRPLSTATAAAASDELIALAGTDQELNKAGKDKADKVMAETEAKEVTAAHQASAPASAGEVLVSPVVPDAQKMLKRQVASSDTATARTIASQQAASKAKTRLLGVASPALSGVAAGRGPATPMPVPAAIKPAPVGGSGAMREYIRKTALEFEPEARAMRLTGLVHVKFTIGADGKLTDFKVTRGLRDDYDAEAIRIISEGPAWQPGVAGGRRAPLPMEVTVPF